MKSNITLKRAKIELHLFTLLEKTNKEFTLKWKHCQDSNKEPSSFQDCAHSYQTIMELIEYNREKNNISDLLESYYLEAWFGKIQSNLNDIPQNPSKDIIENNNHKIKELIESLTCLKSEAKRLNLYAKKATADALRKDYRELFNKIDSDTLSKAISERTAIYHYNHAENLIEEATAKNSDYPLKTKFLENAIGYFDFSAFLYKKAENIKHADETVQRQKEIKKQLKHLKKSLPPTLKLKKIPAKTVKFLALNNASKTSDDSHPIKQKNQAELHNNDARANYVLTLPPKKRKNWIVPDEEGPARKKLKVSFLPINEIKTKTLSDEKESIRKKFYIAPSKIKVTMDVLLKNEEKKVQQRKQEFKKILNQTPVNNPFRFYGQLFFDLSQRLKICSKESSNHTLLTQLSWLTIARQLIQLVPNKNPTDHTAFETISGHLSSIFYNHKKNLATISSQKRGEAYPTYNLLDLQAKNLQNLLIEEIIDYYYGLEAFKLTSAATNFLDLIPHVINKYSFTNLVKEIENTILSVDKPNENLFCANLLRELVKFYICDENTNWRNTTFSSENKINLSKEYLRILTLSHWFAEGSSRDNQDLINKIQQLKNYLLQQFPEQNLTLSDHAHSSSSFFQPPKQSKALSIELLNNTLQEHFRCLLKYKAPFIHSETIYKDLLRFIQTFCKQEQVDINYSKINSHS